MFEIMLVYPRLLFILKDVLKAITQPDRDVQENNNLIMVEVEYGWL
jgi:hypothetical protein